VTHDDGPLDILRRGQEEAADLAPARAQHGREGYRELFELAPDACFVTDRNGIVRDANAAASKMLQIDVTLLAGTALAALVDAADTRVVRAAVDAVRAKRDVEVEVRLKPRTGDPTWHSLKGASVESSSALLWVARNVHRRHARPAAHVVANDESNALATQRCLDLERANRDKDELLDRERSLRTRLENAHAAKDRFLAVLTHDLRAPLNAVLGWTEMLRREPLDTHGRDRALATIEHNARAQLRLIEELLDISRIAADTAQLDQAPVDLAKLVQRTADGFAPSAHERGVTLSFVTATEPLVVSGDRGRLERVLTNLVSNALKFTSPGGRVALSVARDATEDGFARVTVEDNGRGIEPRLLPQMFDAFRQAADYTTSRDGLGLGLYVVRQVVELHGGRVDVASEGPGRGSRFTVWLPLVSSSPTSSSLSNGAPASQAASREAELRGVRVLVVDDEEDARDLMATVLRQRGAIVTTAGDVAMALAAFDEGRPDVVVSDIGMPGRDGLDLVRELRARWNERASYVAISGFASAEEVERALAAGFDLHVAKPVEPAELVSVVRSAARARVR
jgi:PAS domain S-box-containing protein